MKAILFPLVAALTLSCSQSAQGQKKDSQDPVKTDLEAVAFNDRIASDNGVLVDVRTPAEYASGHLAGAINLDWTGKNYEADFASLSKDRPVLVYCAMGGRSDQAKEYLEEKGYTVIQLLDGIGGWKKADLPVVKD